MSMTGSMSIASISFLVSPTSISFFTFGFSNQIAKSSSFQGHKAKSNQWIKGYSNILTNNFRIWQCQKGYQGKKNKPHDQVFLKKISKSVDKFAVVYRHWPRVFTLTIAHYIIHHYRISVLNLSHFPQFRTNLSETLHGREVR